MLHMIYSEWYDDSTASIINFVEGYQESVVWAQKYFEQYMDTVAQHVCFHWQDIPEIRPFTLDRTFKFHPDGPSFSIINGFAACFVIPIDGEFDTNEFMKIKEFNSNNFPWGHLLETLLSQNEKELIWLYT